MWPEKKMLRDITEWRNSHLPNWIQHEPTFWLASGIWT